MRIPLSLFLSLCSTAIAQSTTIPLNSKATFLHTNNDSGALASPAVSLASLGAAPGQWLLIEQLGEFDNGPQADVFHSLLGIFSADATLLAASNLNRVPGSIPAGAAATTANTFSGSQPTNIADDFWISHSVGKHDALVRVPAGAAFLFVAPHDSLYNDNSDPDGDYAMRISIVAAPAYPGTAEDIELSSGIDAAPTTSPALKSAAPGSQLTVVVDDRYTTTTGATSFLFLQPQLSPFVAPGALADTWFGANALLLVGPTALPADGISFTTSVPAGLSGLQLVFQGGAIYPLARNGLYITTEAHRITLL
ncbi:MAG: hypothetical protein EPO68_05200 [Planctomycetota bacterium]|nr:MAG: hypothetical protein EPO68_05200 [Planctomycetota bacterium]